MRRFFLLLVVVAVSVVISIIENVARNFDFMLILCIESTFSQSSLLTHRDLMCTLFRRLQSANTLWAQRDKTKAMQIKEKPNKHDDKSRKLIWQA